MKSIVLQKITHDKNGEPYMTKEDKANNKKPRPFALLKVIVKPYDLPATLFCDPSFDASPGEVVDVIGGEMEIRFKGYPSVYNFSGDEASTKAEDKAENLPF